MLGHLAGYVLEDHLGLLVGWGYPQAFRPLVNGFVSALEVPPRM